MTTVETQNPGQYDYCENKWHSVNAAFDKDKLVLIVDNGKPESVTVPGGIQQIKIDNPLFFGGFPSAFTPKASLTKDFFNGCIRDVVLNKKAVDWYKDVLNSRNIRRTACPL